MPKAAAMFSARRPSGRAARRAPDRRSQTGLVVGRVQVAPKRPCRALVRIASAARLPFHAFDANGQVRLSAPSGIGASPVVLGGTVRPKGKFDDRVLQDRFPLILPHCAPHRSPGGHHARKVWQGWVDLAQGFGQTVATCASSSGRVMHASRVSGVAILPDSLSALRQASA